MQNVIRVVAAVVDTSKLTLYKEDGTTFIINQGDPRVRRIVTEVTPIIVRQGWADVDIAANDNSYASFEEKSNGAIRFFRIAKAKLKSFFGANDAATSVAEVSVGSIPKAVGEAEKKAVAAVEEIMQHAIPANDPEFTEYGLDTQANIVEENGITPNAHTSSDAEDTIIAVVDNKVIPGVEKIKSQFDRASKLGSTIGVENFLRRLGAVIEQRNHSVEDLLKFLERADLPIADDGSILIYKVLRKADKDTYVDYYTKKVEQWLGAYVCMAHNLVDMDRRNQCSNGLHVARRGYISNFKGDVCTLCKLDPEDVIAVPAYDANKMRVCGYHILFELTEDQYSLVRRNKPITNTEDGKILLAKAMRGEHIGRTHRVEITQHKGGGVVVTKLDQSPKAKETDEPVEVIKAEALNNPQEEVLDQAIDPKAVADSVEQETKVVQLSRKEKVAAMVLDVETSPDAYCEAEAWNTLKDFKKQTKVGWEALGVPAELVRRMENKGTQDEAKPIKTALAAEEASNLGSPRERIQKLLNIGLTSVGTAQAILTLKRKSKKSWDTLGVTEKQVEAINKLVGTST